MPKLNATLTILGACLLVMALYALCQPQIALNEGLGWDGVEYHRIYDHLKRRDLNSVVAYPFCKRIGLPYLAAMMPLPATQAFLAINLLSGLASVICTYLALRPTFNKVTVIASLLPMTFYLYSPLRFPHFYPFIVDPPPFCFYAIAALFISRRMLSAATVVLAFSGLFRESGFYFAFAVIAFMLADPEQRRPALWGLAVTIGCFVLAYLIEEKPCEGSAMQFAISTIHWKFRDLEGWVRFIAALLMTCGAFLLGHDRRRMGHAPPTVSTVLLLLAVAMAAAGGHDTTRIFFAAYPLYAAYLASLIANRHWLHIAIASLWGLVTNHFAMIITEPLSHNPHNDSAGYFSLFPDYANINVAIVIVLSWLVLQLALPVLSNARTRSQD